MANPQEFSFSSVYIFYREVKKVSKRYPFLPQEGSKDCGVTCLAMIICYYHGKVPLEQLREMTNTNKNGVTAYHLIECAKELGFETRGIKTSLENITPKIIYPCIAHVVLKNKMQHYIVLYKNNPKKQQLLIADPSDKKLRKISYHDFSKMWDGIIIELYPVKKLPMMEYETSVFQVVKDLFYTCRKELLQIILLSIFITLFSICGSFYFQYMIDGLNHYVFKNYYIGLCLVFLGIAILKMMSGFFRSEMMTYTSKKINYLLIGNAFRQLLHLPYHYYRNRTTGEIVARLNEITSLEKIMSKIVVTIFVDLSLSIVALICLFSMNTQLAWYTVLIAILHVIVLFLFRTSFETYIRKLQQQKADVTSYMVEAISGYETIKNQKSEDYVYEKFESKYGNFQEFLAQFEHQYHIQTLFSEFIGQAGFLFLILIGIFLVLEQQISVGKLLTFHMMFSYFLEPIRLFVELDTDYKEGKQSMKRLVELFYEEKKAEFILSFSFPIELKDVCYSYDGINALLDHVSFKIDEGEKILILGSSGSGKSTLMKLLLKYHKVKRDSIFIGGFDINDCFDKVVHENISYVSQNETLFTGTLYENITLGREIEEKKLWNIIKLCEVDHIIKQNQQGYFMLIEENGFNLSGGEKERIFLARTLVNLGQVLIIDEGMSQMDISMERRILKRIFHTFPNLTLLLISHRLDNQDLFSRKIILEEGKLLEDVKRNDGI